MRMEEPQKELRILVVDDNAVNRRIAVLLLKRVGLSADEASDGFSALGAVDKNPYDLILMDVQMPRMDGLEATRQIRQKYSNAAQPKIVAVTAHEERARCLASGMNDYIEKPLTPKELQRVIDTTPTGIILRPKP
jgi:CheY-like chemotaxis protein